MNLFHVIVGVTTHKDIIDFINSIVGNLNDLIEDVSDVPDLIEEKIAEHKPRIKWSTIKLTPRFSEVKGSVDVKGDEYTLNLTVPYTEVIDDYDPSKPDAAVSSQWGKRLQDRLEELYVYLNKIGSYANIYVASDYCTDDSYYDFNDILTVFDKELSKDLMLEGMIIINDVKTLMNDIGIYLYTSSGKDNFLDPSNWRDLYKIFYDTFSISKLFINPVTLEITSYE